MARVSCRCGETLDYDPYGPERIVCPRCGSKVRVRRPIPGGAAESRPKPHVIPVDDGYIRFPCPCGRRLKIRAKDRPEAGRCPDCGRIVPVPATAWNVPGKNPRSEGFAPDDQRTGEFSPEDIARISTWTQHWAAKREAARPVASRDRPDEGSTPASGVPLVNVAPRPSSVKMEAGLRVCPRCGKPVHLGAANCRECGALVPKR